MVTRFSARNLSILLLLVMASGGCSNGGSWLNGKSWNPFAAKERTWKPPMSDPVAQPTTDQKVDMQMAIIRSMEQKKEFDQAIPICEELYKKYPKRADVINRLAILYDKKGDPDQARRYHKLAVERDPKNAEILCDSGYSKYLNDDYGDAENDFRKALKYNPRMTRAHNNLALLLAHTKKHEAALSEFSRAGCSPAQSRVNLAHAMIWDEQWQAAEQQLLLALETDPTLQVAEHSLAQLRALQAKRQSGIGPAEQTAKAMKRLPNTGTPAVPNQVRESSVARANAKTQLPPVPAAPSQIAQSPMKTPEASTEFVTQAANIEREQQRLVQRPSSFALPQAPLAIATSSESRPRDAAIQVLAERTDRIPTVRRQITTNESTNNLPSAFSFPSVKPRMSTEPALQGVQVEPRSPGTETEIAPLARSEDTAQDPARTTQLILKEAATYQAPERIASSQSMQVPVRALKGEQVSARTMPEEDSDVDLEDASE